MTTTTRRGRGGAASAPSGATTACQGRPGAVRPPCSLRSAFIKCRHCGVPATPTDPKRPWRGLEWSVNARGVALPTAASAPARSPTNNQLHIVAERTQYAEQVTLEVVPAARGGRHPALSVWAIVNGRGQQVGRTVIGVRANLPVSYDPSWFSNAVASVRTQGLRALARIIFPSPAEFHARADTCGTGPTQFGHALFRVFVYPGDKFKLGIALPPFRQADEMHEGGTQDGQAFQREQIARQRNGQTVSNYEMSTRQTPGGAIVQTRQSAGVGPGRVITQRGRNRVVNPLTPTQQPGYAAQVARSITLEREGNDIADSFGVGRIIDGVTAIHGIVRSAISYIQGLGRRSPQVGWRLSFNLALFVGSISLEWQWKEDPNSRLVYKSIKLEGELKIIEAGITLSFGVSLLGAVAKIEGNVTASLILRGSAATRPNPRIGPEVEIDAINRTDGTARVVAGWEGTLAVEGSVTSGIDIVSKLRFPNNRGFSWTASAELRDGKGTGTITVIGLRRSREWKFWDKQPLGRALTII